MKQLTCIAVSTILYMKNAFSEENYHTETFANIKLRLLKKTCSDETAQFVSSSMLAALSAVEKKYLDSIALCFYEGEDTANNLSEYHIFKYHYKSGEATMTISSKSKDTERRTSCSLQDVKKKTLQMIRACMVFMSCSNLFTENTNIGIRIYFTSDAPDGYEVPGFTFVDEEIDPLMLTMSESIKLGCVETPYHSLTARGNRSCTFKDSNEAYASQNVPVLTNDTDFSDTIESKWNCPCNKYNDKRDTALLTCQYCKNVQHAVCYGIPEENAADVTGHCCIQCYDNDNTRTATDSSLTTMAIKKRSSICLFRRALAVALQMSTVGSEDFVRNLELSEQSAINLLRTFFSYEIIKKEPQPMLQHKIMKDNLNRVYSDYFQRSKFDSIISQSKAVPNDPLSQVLSPSEKINLQSASNICELVEMPSGSNKNESMAEYEGAISNIDIHIMPPIKKVAKRKIPSRASQEKAKRGRK
ncbi:unnamed protein product [Pieris macdunnoughi]|uniref:HORMA domain-containing protein n=2 Tax=Pieris macdunnoughi TaxID=345717 RepID=A0A821SAU4_9NEOP|nr:unnamed protein product [Pieris macdunnoughi]